MSISVAIRADASPETGLGHVMRCRALAQALVAKGAKVSFYSRGLSASLQDMLITEGSEGVAVGEQSLEEEAQWFANTIATAEFDWVVLDGYQLDAAYEAELAKVAKVVWIDDFANRESQASLVVHSTPLSDEQAKVYGLELSSCLVGPEYILLRDEFRTAQSTSEATESVAEVLVTFGGGDAEQMTAKVLQALAAVEQIKVTVLLGQYFTNAEELKSQFANYPHSINWVENATSVASYMSSSTLAVTASGATVWELAATKTPMVVIPVAENQLPIAEYLEQQSAAKVLPWYEQLEENQITATVSELADSNESRLALAQAANDLCDGNGAARVVDRMLELSDLS